MKKKLLKVFLLISLIFLSSFILFLFILSLDLPSVEELENFTPPEATIVYDYRDRIYGDIGVQRRFYVPLDEIPIYVRQAFISAEDKNFYDHFGIDIGAIIRAMLVNIKHRRIVQGGSTITQQLAKNLFLTHERNIIRKIKEMILAIKIERRYSKDKILELYLNQIYLGSGAYGVEAASRIYFGKSVKELTLEEAATLAGLPKAPAKFNPFTNPKIAKERRNYVLKRMYEDKYITKEEYESAIRKPLIVETDNRFYGMDYFLDMVQQYLFEKYGELALAGGLKVYTTIDRDLQKLAQKVVHKGILRIAKSHGIPVLPETKKELEKIYMNQPSKIKPGNIYIGYVEKIEDSKVIISIKDKNFEADIPSMPIEEGKFVLVKAHKFRKGVKLEVLPDLQGALVSMDAKTGEIRAVVGGYSYVRSPYNRALKAKRQPGSAIKPIIYLAALMRGYTQISMIDAMPRSYYDPSTGEYWTPHNYDNKEYGIVTLRMALAKSINTATVNLLDELGFEIVMDIADRIGIKDLKPFYSLALGTIEVTPLELTSAYQAFANLGIKCKPFFIRKIVDKYGNIIEENSPECKQVLPPQEVRVLIDMLRAVVTEGTGRRAMVLNRIVAGKTGTTDNFMDAWFVGFSPYIVTGVWVGFDIKRTLGEHMSGARVALPIWIDFMSVATAKYPDEDFPLPEGTVIVSINKEKLVRADETCPGIPMIFVEGTEPDTTCSDIEEDFQEDIILQP